MTKPDFRELLVMLALWAKAAYELQVEFFKANGYECFNLPKRLSYQPTYQPWPRDWKAETEAKQSNPYYQLYCVADKVLKFPKSLWPASVTPSEETDEFLDILKFVNMGNWYRKQNTTIDRLKCIIELAKSILDGKTTEAKEPLALVSDPPKGPVTATTDDSKRTVELARSIPDGKPVVVFPPVGKLTAEGWWFGEKRIHVQDWLRPALRAYLDGETCYALVADNEKPYDMQACLKKLILLAKKYGFDPPQNSWPSGTKRHGCMPFVHFNSTEDGNRRNRGDHAKNR